MYIYIHIYIYIHTVKGNQTIVHISCACVTVHWDALLAQAPIERKTAARRLQCLEGLATISTTGTVNRNDIQDKDPCVHRLSAVRAHISRRERSTCVLVAGPSEQLIEDAKDQSAHHRKDARRQRRFAHHAVYLQ